MKHLKQLLIPIILLFFCSCQNKSADQTKKATPEVESDYKAVKTEVATTSDSACLADASWFTKVGGTRQTPAPNEGSTSVFANNITVTNCDFHRWSWQKFLYLTNEVNGQPYFLTSLKQVTSAGGLITESRGVNLTDTAQASSSTDILKSNSSFNSNGITETVYYSIHMDDGLYNTMVQYGPIAKTNPAAIKDMTYPIGALELKISWINVDALADTSTYFITNGVINNQVKRVALLGMHVVGVVENHPEFVWATFEHENLAPAYDWSQATPTTDAPVTSSSDYLFFNKNDTASVTNISSGNGIYTNIFSLYKYGVPVEKETKNNVDVETFMPSSQAEPKNFGNITTINASVKSQLSGIWNNYFYNGSIWINTEGYVGTTAQAELLDSLGYNLSSVQPGDLTRGSVSNYNLTMETYVQAGFGASSIHGLTNSNLVNCFSCHNTVSGGNSSPLNISHIFKGYVKNLQGMSKEEIKRKHVAEINRQFVLRQKLRAEK